MGLIALVSDSHDNIEAVVAALEAITSRNPDLVLHCGDFVSPSTFGLFAGLPMQSVLGNCDPPASSFVEESQRVGLSLPRPELELEVGGKTCYVYHGHQPSVVEDMALTGQYDYVFHGHIHMLRDVRIGDTRIICPGALSRAARYTIGFLDVTNDLLEVVEIPDR